MDFLEKYLHVRARSERICASLKVEDYVVQPIVDVSPPKWHLGHTTWFWETFVLKENLAGYTEFDKNYNYVFNSYYESVGARVIRTDRGNLSRPSVEDVYRYRKHVDEGMQKFLSQEIQDNLKDLILLGINHEEQHQELLLTDIKYILGHNPLLPEFDSSFLIGSNRNNSANPILIPEGVYEIGHNGTGFCFDNELSRHKVYLQSFEISNSLVTNEEYILFVEAGGYTDFRYWHAEGWEWIKANQIKAPLYWYNIDDQWMNYTFGGLQLLDQSDPVCHISYYEATAFAAWREMRLPTEAEWEIASSHFSYGRRWEWTESAYLPYPGFDKAPGALGEYNGKFMVNQMVLRGASDVTTPGHSRSSYRNFFQPTARWQYTGIRLAK